MPAYFFTVNKEAHYQRLYGSIDVSGVYNGIELKKFRPDQ